MNTDDNTFGGSKRTVRSDRNAKSAFFSPKSWYKIDNAGIIYAPSVTDEYSEGFRFSVVLKEEVNVDVLNQAIADIFPRFPSMFVTLKRGCFWFYLEKLSTPYEAIPEKTYPYKPFGVDDNLPCVRILYGKRRIACEFFHSVTDGAGGNLFFITLLTRYYEILRKVTINDGVFNHAIKPTPAEVEDSFARCLNDVPGKDLPSGSAYVPKLKKGKNGSLLAFTVDSNELYKLAKSNNATITEFITGVTAQIQMELRERDGDKKPFQVQIPINLRGIFNSVTLRNFSYYVGVRVYEKQKTLKDYIDIIKQSFKAQVNKDNLQSMINYAVKGVSYVGFIPTFIKCVACRVAKKFLGDDNCFSNCISNVGRLTAPEPLYSLIDRIELSIREPKNAGYKMAIASFADKCVISITRTYESAEFEARFAKALADFGLKVYIDACGDEL